MTLNCWGLDIDCSSKRLIFPDNGGLLYAKNKAEKTECNDRDMIVMTSRVQELDHTVSNFVVWNINNISSICPFSWE